MHAHAHECLFVRQVRFVCSALRFPVRLRGCDVIRPLALRSSPLLPFPRTAGGPRATDRTSAQPAPPAQRDAGGSATGAAALLRSLSSSPCSPPVLSPSRSLSLGAKGFASLRLVAQRLSPFLWRRTPRPHRKANSADRRGEKASTQANIVRQSETWLGCGKKLCLAKWQNDPTLSSIIQRYKRSTAL